MSLQAVEVEFAAEPATSLASRASAASSSAVSWPAIAAGAVAISALTLVLLAFGAGMGFMAVSPWNSAPPSTTFGIVAGIYLLVVGTLSSTVGGYIAGRLRTKWVNLHTHEVFFRDTAHGFLAWAFAAVISAAVLGTAATAIVGGSVPGMTQAGAGQQGSDKAAYYVDGLLRPQHPTAGQNSAAANDDRVVRAEVGRILTTGIIGDMAPEDRSYLNDLVASRTGLSPADAEKRVGEVIAQAKDAADRARKAAGALSFWLAASMLLGAFAASLAATEGGWLRDNNPPAA